MPRPGKSLIFKFSAVVLLVEFFVLTSLGLFYTETFSREMDRYLVESVQAPGKLMNRQLLRYESVGSEEVMKELVGEAFLDGMVVGAGGRIYYAFRPGLTGRNISEVPEARADLLTNTDEQVLYYDQTRHPAAIVSITPLHAYRGAKPFFRVYIRATTADVTMRKRQIAGTFIFGSALCIILTSLAIIGYSRRHVAKPLSELTRSADALTRGNLDVPVPMERHDEIGVLAQSLDTMRHAIKANIRELQLANLALKDREGRLQALIDAHPDRIILTDWHGRLLDIHPGDRDDLLLKPEAMQGRKPHDLYEPELAGNILTLVRRTITTGQSQNLEYTLQSENGLVWFDGRTSRVGDEDGEDGTVVWVARDITYRKEMEKRMIQSKEEVERMNQRLRELDRTKSTLVSSVSHELRTPLTSLLGFSKLILKNFSKHFWPLAKGNHQLLTKGSQIVENLNILLHEGERLSRLINDVLDLNKIEMGYTEWHMERIQPGDLVRRAANAVSGQFDGNRDLSLATRVDDGLPDIVVDPDRMLQVLLNLLTNAAKFTGSGTVTLAASSPAAGLVRFQVTDTGPGIPPEERERVFDIFHQVGKRDPADDKPQGAGLGLAICREIVLHHQGTIWVESELGKGSSFIFELPVH
ncbi:ATP-binding protein [Pseudodesulfovibrio sp.]|uniref:ATP-binding protein n=1 Tax=Pseudodesulfovibrio sp. TaxID=2035812 RepID=UPI00260379F3|nr:ATP-binding protein [Pseudodesulfovibrio sp.]MDD3310715.1 ATP-binding protein [Pseudodesulfovibrio sp.]